MRKLSFLDSAFLLAESRETPMHVGSVNLFTLPSRADSSTFLHELSDQLKSGKNFQPIFGDKPRRGALGSMYWEPDKNLDINYHIRHSALPAPGRYRELFTLVSRLHATLLDRNRPLWEMHLIEGLKDRQFAVYSKYHHAAIDGVRSMHLTQSMYSTSARARMHDSPLSMAAMERYRESLERAAIPPSYAEIRNVADRLKAAYDSGVHLTGALKQFSSAWMGRGGALSLPWLDVPRSPINTHVDGARRFVAQSWPFERIRAVGKALDGTFNDAVLAMCAGALRAYLKRQQGLPSHSLKAMVPVSLRREGDIDSSNAVGAISADLGTNIKDPLKRFALIQSSTRAGKDMFKGMSAKESELFMQVTQLPGVLLIPLGLIGRFPPYNTVISNVPGPRKPMYWNGARLEGIYPASIVSEGVALNITLVSYGKNVDFGIIACRRTLPQVQRLIDDLEDALQELEDAAGLQRRKTKKRPRKK
jgi:WS/DGAT/MGAT family acyltransferase